MTKQVLVFAFTLFTVSTSVSAQSETDSIYNRAQRMVSDGSAAEGRAIVDSMLRTARRGSPSYAEALYWRAVLGPTSQQSEQDYRRLIVEYPLYARTGDVLLRLAQLELLRGNRDAAVVHLRRIQTEHPEFGNQAAASFWLGKVLFEKNDASAACAAIAEAKRLVKPEDVELKNQIDFQDQQCVGVALSTPDTSSVQIATEPEPTPKIAPVSTPPAAEATGTGYYSVQVAAYNKLSQASALSARLKKRGFAVRVDGKKAPFRVRIGKYETRAAATAAQQRMKKSGISGLVVKAE